MLLCRLVCGRRDRRRSGRGGWVIGSRKSWRELRRGRSTMSSTTRRSTGCRSAGSSCTMWVWSDVVRKRGKWWASCSDWLWIFCDKGKGKWDQSWSYAVPDIVLDPDVLIDKGCSGPRPKIISPPWSAAQYRRLPSLPWQVWATIFLEEFPSLNETFLTNPFAEQTTAGGRKLYEDAWVDYNLQVDA